MHGIINNRYNYVNECYQQASNGQLMSSHVNS